jgi:hypothetical protein
MISEFKFFSKNNGEDVFNVASMRNIGGVQYRNLIYNDYGDPIQRVNMGGVFPYSGDQYQFTWIETSVAGEGHYIEGHYIEGELTYHGSLPNFLMQYRNAEILIYRIDFYGEMFFRHNCNSIYHFTNEEPYRNLTIHAIII